MIIIFLLIIVELRYFIIPKKRKVVNIVELHERKNKKFPIIIAELHDFGREKGYEIK